MSSHSTPQDGTTCQCCWDDITEQNYVEYKSSENGSWMPSGFCQMCIGELIKTQFEGYVNALKSTKCKAEQRRLLERGPPVNVFDAKALPCADNNNGEVHALWFMSDGQEHSAKLDGSLTGEVGLSLDIQVYSNYLMYF